MSNYSDFFGVGSSGGGGGIPINGYTPFLTIATGNPSGYDATTGLYTHPDGTFWLETGNLLVDAAGDYSNATSAFQASGRTNTVNNNTYGPKTSETWWSGGSGRGSVHNLVDWSDTITNTFTTQTINLGPGLPIDNSRAVPAVYDPTNDVTWIFYWFRDQGANNRQVRQSYDHATGTVQYSNVSVAPANSQQWDGASSIINGNSGTPLVAYSNLVGSWTVWDVTDPTAPAGVGAGGLPSLSPSPSAYQALPSANADCLWLSAVSGTNFIEYNITTGATGNTFDYTPGRPKAWNTSFSNATATQYWMSTPVNVSEHATVVGDSTARTDTDTSQPLFIRLK